MLNKDILDIYGVSMYLKRHARDCLRFKKFIKQVKSNPEHTFNFTIAFMRHDDELITKFKASGYVLKLVRYNLFFKAFILRYRESENSPWQEILVKGSNCHIHYRTNYEGTALIVFHILLNPTNNNKKGNKYLIVAVPDIKYLKLGKR